MDVGNLISGSSASLKFSLYIWKFSVQVLLKPNLKDFEYYLVSMWKSESENCSVTSDSSWHNRLYSPWNFPGQNTGIGSCSLLQGILPTQRSNPGLPHCRWILYQLSHQGSPRILEWVAFPFSSGSSWPGNRNRVSCIAGRFFISWSTREALLACEMSATVW